MIGRVIKVVVVVYRPPFSEAHPVSSNVFLEELSTYLENIVMCPEVLIIAGDFNFHLDSPSDGDARKFNDLMENLGLARHLKFPPIRLDIFWISLSQDRLMTLMFSLHKSPSPSLTIVLLNARCPLLVYQGITVSHA